MIKKTVVIALLVSFTILFCTRKQSPLFQSSEFNLPKSTLISEGFDSLKFQKVIQFVEDTVKGIRSMVIVRNGKVVYEKYYHIYNPDTTFLLYSSTKSIMSILTGMAIQDSLIKGGLKAKILDFFPEKHFDNLTESKKNMTIEDLLTLRTGLKLNDNTDDFFDNKDPVKFILDKPMDTIPGIKWSYNSGSAHILSSIISRVSGIPTLEFARKKLFKPLGITDYNWWIDTKGVCFGGYGLHMKPKDLAKIGMLMLQNGKWGGVKLINEQWVKTSTSSHTSTYWPADGNYGYLWWVNEFGGFSSRGLFGQIMYVLPEKNMVIVFTSGLEASIAGKRLNAVVKDYILPSVN